MLALTVARSVVEPTATGADLSRNNRGPVEAVEEVSAFELSLGGTACRSDSVDFSSSFRELSAVPDASPGWDCVGVVVVELLSLFRESAQLENGPHESDRLRLP